jgi:hypothetical protein
MTRFDWSYSRAECCLGRGYWTHSRIGIVDD